MTEDEFCQRFKARMLHRVYPRTHFDDGESIADYADDTAPTYWEQEHDRKEGPEACADTDISYWGD